MNMARRPVLITGIGLISSLGEGPQVHVEAVRTGRAPIVDTQGFAPYPVHPLGAIEYDRQIPKKSDQRQMEGWQKLGVHAAGLALDSAGLKEDVEAKAALQLIVAAGGGERDHATDGAILTGMRDAADPDTYLNERLMSDIRPTLFLAQLSNLLAGNISIVLGVTGASRTFMGEEQAGVDALRTAHARIAARQDEAIMVGGAYNAERRDMLTLFALGGCLRKGGFAPVFERTGNGSGMITGSVGAFLVLESEASAAARGVKAFARLDAVVADRGKRSAGGVEASLAGLISAASGANADTLVVSAATGIEQLSREEEAALAATAKDARRIAAGDLVGHGVEAAFPVAVALAAALVHAGDADNALVTGVAHWRGEGVAHLSKAG